MSDDGVPRYVRYNRQWLEGIRITEELIRSAPIDQVPLEYRSLIKQQFKAHVEAFRNDLDNGFGTSKAQAFIADIVALAMELIAAAECAAAAYGR